MDKAVSTSFLAAQLISAKPLNSFHPLQFWLVKLCCNSISQHMVDIRRAWRQRFGSRPDGLLQSNMLSEIIVDYLISLLLSLVKHSVSFAYQASWWWVASCWSGAFNLDGRNNLNELMLRVQVNLVDHYLYVAWMSDLNFKSYSVAGNMSLEAELGHPDCY